MLVFVGCYTTLDRNGQGKGIRAYQMNNDTGEWIPFGPVAEVANPSFLALDPTERCLYCVHGGTLSEVSAFRIRPAARLEPLGSVASGGENPVHLSFHPSGRWLVVANYTGSTLAVLPVGADGRLGPASDLVTVSGECGPDPIQQNAAHPHDIPFDPSGRFVAVPDKGLDRVFILRVDAAAGRFVPASPPWLRSQPGAGPRHIAFHPNRRLAYVINELNSTISAYAFESNGDELDELQTITSLPPSINVKNTGAEIAVHPNGQWVYVSNRGHNSIGAFGIDERDGTLQPISWESTQGDTPRAFSIDPAGRFLYVANQASHTIVAFRVDDQTGKLSATGQVTHTGSPSSIAFTATRQGS